MIYRYGLGAVLVLTLFSACKLKRASVSPAAVSRLDHQAQDQQTVSAPASIPKVDWDEDDDQDFDKNSKFYLIEQNQLGLVQPVRPVRRFKGELDVIGWKVSDQGRSIKEATARNNRDQGKPGDPVSSREEASPQKISYKNSKGVEKFFDTESADSIKWEGEGADQPKFVLLLEKDAIKFLQSIPKDFYVEELVSYQARGWSSYINWFTNSPRIFRIQKLTAVVEKRVKKLADMGVTFPYPWMVQGNKYMGFAKHDSVYLEERAVPAFIGGITPEQSRLLIKHYQKNPLESLPFEIKPALMLKRFKEDEAVRLANTKPTNKQDEWMYNIPDMEEKMNGLGLKVTPGSSWIQYTRPLPKSEGGGSTPRQSSPASLPPSSDGGSSTISPSRGQGAPTGLPETGGLIDQPLLSSPRSNDLLKVEDVTSPDAP